MKIPYFRQEKIWTCGAAVIRMVLASFNIKRSEGQLVRMLRTSKRVGVKNKRFSEIAERFKLSYIVRRNSNIRQLKRYLNKKFIIIVHYYVPKLGEDHYSVVSRVSKERIFLLDPWFGENYSIDLDKFIKLWKENPKSGKEKHWFIGIKEDLDN